MCGIAGYVGFDDPALLRSMCASLQHRGPDDEGFFEAPGVGLCIRRLSIIDLRTGKQPIANEAGDVHVVFNGEVYNYQELTDRLKRRGHRFSTTSDTETIVHLYEDEGLDFAVQLRGMFAIALWDARLRRLVLVRDRIGEKPLYYSYENSQLLFGSELKAILQARRPRQVDRQTVCDFLAVGYVPPPRTFYHGISKLPPGHELIFENGRIQTRPYWKHSADHNGAPSFDQACDRLADLLREAVQLCLKSDVEVGAFLSGGIDSSTIVALMRQFGSKVQTFSVGYSGTVRGFSELPYARRVADELGTRHHELVIGARPTMELLPRILWHYDEPHGEPTSVLVFLLSEFTRRYLKVAVGGTGGDEIFFGYPRHAAIRYLQYYRCLPCWFRSRLVERIVARWPESTLGSRFAKRVKRFVRGSDLPADEAYLTWISLLSVDVREALVTNATRAEAADPLGEAFLRRYLAGPDHRDLLGRAAALDVEGYLPEFQLAYMDRMSMAHGLEVRSPLCDYRLVEFVTSLPASYRLRGSRSKHIFKAVATRWIPRAISERRKVGFDSPIGQWAKTELGAFFDRFLSPEHVARSGLVNPEAVTRLRRAHASGRVDYSLQIWSLLALEAWYRMYVEDMVIDGGSYRLHDLRGADPNVGVAVRSSPRGAVPRPNGTSSPPIPQAAASAAISALQRRMWERTPPAVRRSLRPVLTRVPASFLLGGDFRHWYRFVDGAQWWSQDRARQYQLARLQEICSHATRRSAFYREHFHKAGLDPSRIGSFSDFENLPTIGPDTVRTHLDRMCAVSPKQRGIDRVSTGGTDGAPLTFYIGADRSAIEYAYLAASWRRAGYKLELPLVVLRSRVVAADQTGLHHEFDPLLRHHYLSTFHMSDGNMLRYVGFLRALGPCFLHVYPSSVALLARFVERTDLEPPSALRGIIAESEVVYPEQRSRVESVFACRYFSCYGHSEKLVLATECEHSTDYHVWPTYGYFELLDAAGRAVTTPGQRGEIVGTGFINRVVPFIRYRTGDFATWVGDRCNACGRSHPLLRDIRSHRTQEVLVAGDGSLIPWTAVNMHDATFDRVQQFQFYQDTPGLAVLRVVPANGFSDADDVRIRRALELKLDGRVRINLERVGAVKLSPRGKGIYVDQRIGVEDVAT